MKAVLDFPDIAWLSRLRHDDGRAFDALFRHYSPRVYRFAYSYLKTRAAAEEIVQECFLKIWEKRHELRDDVPLKGYLFTTAHHLILNQLRHVQHQVAYQDFLRHVPPTEGNMEKDVEYAELETVYLAALAKLPPKRRRIFTLSRQQGLSYPEIARELNISVKTVETQMAQALKFLRLYFKLHGNVLIVLPLLISINSF
ncbi:MULTISPECIES: RNA polymerase sigma-70 factor [Hymenobacter]|uniref:RNA polymerase sigma-70 factor n=2 Tax=Hymenobacter TaxID=89966 RepID=A0ABS6WWT8_9BACT|nr:MULTISPECIES: RNA polymerase sigma-70 factor [Hymenobacter]MBO3271453.1 RNA polymerase sigma-70 factor [Hymenobacter defluvii]MBW3128055.1 RNA polymerase sigma-70 factor [Hymenobacter profundi]